VLADMLNTANDGVSHVDTLVEVGEGKGFFVSADLRHHVVE
jgi:hypothetical protein